MKSPLFFLSLFFLLAVFVFFIIQIGSSLEQDTIKGCYVNETGDLTNCSLSNDDYALFTQAGASGSGSVNILTGFILLVTFLGVISGLFLFRKLSGGK
jgi:hypothetical protein